MRTIERFHQAWLAFMAPPSATWYVVENLEPLGWRVVWEEGSYEAAAAWSVANMPQGSGRVRVMRADLWGIRMLGHLRSDVPWLYLGKMATAANRWREHEYEVDLLARARGADRSPERATGGVPTLLPVQHGTGWPVDAPTTPVPGLSIENDPEHVGTRLERALGREERAERVRRRARHVAQGNDSDGGQ